MAKEVGIVDSEVVFTSKAKIQRVSLGGLGKRSVDYDFSLN